MRRITTLRIMEVRNGIMMSPIIGSNPLGVHGVGLCIIFFDGLYSFWGRLVHRQRFVARS